MTRAFLGSLWFGKAVARGWSMIELFGINPDAPVTHLGDWGLVVTLALLMSPGAKIDNITDDSATFSIKSGARNKWPRFQPALRDCVKWWKCGEIIEP